MLTAEHSIGILATAVVGRVAPAIQDIAAFAPASASSRGGLCGGCAVVDDEDFVEAWQADGDQFELRVVVDRIRVEKVGAAIINRRVADCEACCALLIELFLRDGFRELRCINVQQLRVLGDNTVVVQGFVDLLDYVIPKVPLPDDLGIVIPFGLKLDDPIGPESGFGNFLGVPASCNCLLDGLRFPGDNEDVAVRFDGKVVMWTVLLAYKVKFPDDVAVPGQLLKPASLSAATEHRCGRVCTCAHEVAVVLQVNSA